MVPAEVGQYDARLAELDSLDDTERVEAAAALVADLIEDLRAMKREEKRLRRRGGES